MRLSARMEKLERQRNQHQCVAPLYRQHQQSRVRFARDILNFEPDSWQEEALLSSQPLLLNCARQTGKSTVVAILALHQLVYYPASLVLIISPSLRQSSEVFRKLLAFHQAIQNPIPAIRQTVLSLELANGSRCLSLPGKPQTIRGFSAPDLLLLEESAYVADETYQAVRPMLATSQGRMIGLTTPAGRVGWFYRAWTKDSSWQKILAPATACPRIPAAFLEIERLVMGEYFYGQEYGCQFNDALGQIFSDNLIQSAFDADLQPLFLEAA